MGSPRRSAAGAGPRRRCWEGRIQGTRVEGDGQDGASTRLYEVIRARPGYEVAVEAALGEYGAGVLAENLDEG